MESRALDRKRKNEPLEEDGDGQSLALRDVLRLVEQRFERLEFFAKRFGEFEASEALRDSENVLFSIFCEINGKSDILGFYDFYFFPFLCNDK